MTSTSSTTTTTTTTTTTSSSIFSIIPKDSFITKTLSLLDIEKESEVNESVHLQSTLSNRELELKGICIRKLKLNSISTGLGGRCLVKLVSAVQDEYLPPHRFTPGDIVGIRTTKSKPGQSLSSGVVYRVDRFRITISFDEYDEELMADWESFVFAIDKLSNDVTYRKMREALESLRSDRIASGSGGGTTITNQVSSRILDVVFNGAEPHQSATYTSSSENNNNNNNTTLKPITSKLNQTQIKAVEFALGSSDIALIHGPPGTGKTTTVVEFIVQCVRRGQRVLACAPSNLAVDNMLEKLIAVNGINPTRVGHPARIMEGLSKYTLDHKTKNSEEAEVVRGLRKEIADLLKETKSKGTDRDRRRVIGSTIKDLRKDLRSREVVLVEQVIKNSKVVLSTCTGAADYSLRHHDFDIVVIDEAGQALEASCWIAIRKGRRLVLAGDHQQLPPTIHSDDAAKDGLSVTLFERLIRIYGDKISRLLSIQYRMNQSIMNWSSKEFYNSEMHADESVASHLLQGLNPEKIKTTPTTTCPIVLIDTSGCDMEESMEDEIGVDQSKSNIGEARVVATYVKKLLQHGVLESNIGIISPYNGQVKCLKAVIESKQIEIGTVDGFQGREKEVIIISMVRSNPPPHNVGFLKEDRRTNVAITRARRQVVIVADCLTISSYPFLKRMVDYCRETGLVRSALEYSAGDLDDMSNTGQEFVLVSSDEEEWDNEKKSDRNNTSQKLALQAKQKKSIAELKKEKKMAKKKDQNKSKQELEVENEEKKKKEIASLDAMIQQFIKSSNTVYSLPPTLTSYQRMLVHELADKYKLGHESIGEGEQRQITLTKKSKDKKSTSTINIEKVKQKEPEQVKKEEEEEEEEMVVGDDEKDDENEEEEEEKLETKTKTTTKPNQPLAAPKKQSPKKPATTKKPKKATTTQPKKDIGDELLEQFNSLDVAPIDITVCGIKSCKNNVVLLGRICEFCKRKYCNMHALYEIHGCGDRAKVKARQDWFDAYANGVQKETKTHAKLQTKIQENENARKKKPAPGSKKK
ncbi:AN1-type zinc finger-containing protein [Cavenderia fasciculata]|uniref:AN1-type zinc finger-containing protein n=1 Tax=Cavenderia fasciculata TaxID=261658 RepID=F4PK53_CACFS|nr:AN1-type zinc finger-containing protein [Cavenderia fasciculata]EGG23977.1 AN1-type zinc finger-containing protein [Cavenderia fasciculata]|eukprot:XP_004361828.1 AN1-type zinc finger-containing protein [Cavenderia fasciculata]